MPELPFPSSSTPGALPGEGEGRLINVHVHKEGDKAYLRPAPGLVADIDTLGDGPRGMTTYDLEVIGVFEDSSVVSRNSAGERYVFSGTIPGTGQVTFARNMRQPYGDVAIVRSSGGAYFMNWQSGVVSPNSDADLPSTVCSVSYLSGAFIYADPNGAKIWASDVNAMGQNALAYASAETKPDGLIRGVTSGNAFLAMGTASIEPWLNVGSVPFPLSRHTTVIPVGLLAFGAVAGDQEGWDGPLLWAASDGTVRQLDGYTPTIVSTADVERFIASSTTSTLRAFVYGVRGDKFWVLSSDKGTWEYNLGNKSWTERASDGRVNWRALYSAKAGGRWYLGDTLSSRFIRVDETARTELGAPLKCTMESGALQNFPARIAIPAGFFNFAGSAAGNVAIRWSHDGGATWKGPLTRSLLANPVRTNLMGLSTSDGMRVRLEITDPAQFSFMGAQVPEPQARAA
jgi:hypothetical protein